MGGYYPPGVTGMEPEIAGYPEGTMNVECQHTTDTLVRKAVLEAATDAWERGLNINDLIPILEEMQHDPDGVCMFDGEVEVQYVDRTTFVWECPMCGHEHEEEL